MAGRKQPFMRLETKEDFEKLWKEAFKCGYEEGFDDGRCDALIIFQNAIDNNFTPEEQSNAAWHDKQNAIAKWKREEKERKKREEAEYEDIIEKALFKKEL